MGDVLRLETLESLIEEAKNFALSYYKNKGELSPQIVGFTRQNNEKLILMGHFFPTKNEWLECTKLAFAAYDVDKYYVVSESWMVCQDTKPISIPITGSISNHPDRVDVITVVAVNRQGSKSIIYKIQADKTLEVFNIPHGAQKDFRGTMYELLSKPLPQSKRDKLKEKFFQMYNVNPFS
jgi:hypothetical protein